MPEDILKDILTELRWLNERMAKVENRLDSVDTEVKPILECIKENVDINYTKIALTERELLRLKNR